MTSFKVILTFDELPTLKTHKDLLKKELFDRVESNQYFTKNISYTNKSVSLKGNKVIFKFVSDNDDKRSSAFGLAMRITTDLISGVIIGGIMGWSLDRLFGTEPWLLIVFFVFGVFAGISNVIRTAKKMNKLG